MVPVLNKGKEKILRLFYENRTAEFHLREIARRTRFNENSAYRFLKQLEKDHILSSKIEGNLKKFSINKSLLIYAVFAILDVERLDKLPSIRKKAILLFLDHLKQKPVIAFLFGSTAKNSFSEESDIDILLIVNRRIETKETEEFVDAQTGIKVNSFQIDYRSFLQELKLKQDNVIQAAIQTGYPITNHTEYYRCLYDEAL